MFSSVLEVVVSIFQPTIIFLRKFGRIACGHVSIHEG